MWMVIFGTGCVFTGGYDLFAGRILTMCIVCLWACLCYMACIFVDPASVRVGYYFSVLTCTVIWQATTNIVDLPQFHLSEVEKRILIHTIQQQLNFGIWRLTFSILDIDKRATYFTCLNVIKIPPMA